MSEDDLPGFIRELAGRQPTENLLIGAINARAKRIVHWLCDEQKMQLTALEPGQWPHSVSPEPDCPGCHEYYPEMDEEACEALRLLAKAYPGMYRDESLMVSCMGTYCKHYNIKSLRHVLSRGANPDGRDEQGRTPLDFARYHGWKEGIALLRARGARAHTPGRTYEEKEQLNLRHDCATLREQEARMQKQTGGALIPVVSCHFFSWEDPGPDGPQSGIICKKCKAER